MKNTKKERTGRLRMLLYLLLFMTLSQPLAAHDVPVIYLANSGLGKQFAITVKGLSSEAVLQIQSPKGKVLIAKTIQDSIYQQIYDLEALREGPYVVVLKMPTYEIRQPIELNRRAIQYDAQQRATICLPVVRVKGRQLDVELNNPDRVPVRLSLVDEEGALLYDETIKQIADVEKRLNLLNIPGGDYQVRVETPINSWSERVHIQ